MTSQDPHLVEYHADEESEDGDIDDPYAETNSPESHHYTEDTASIAEMYKGHRQLGRTYQSLRSPDYFMPTDDKQWEANQAGHLLCLLLDSRRKNILFRSQISPNAKHILDVGTGPGDWALECADKFPNITVHGVDLYPPPHEYTAPNCVFEIDDLCLPWTFRHRFDFVHLRHLLGAFDVRDWRKMYKNAYDNLEPGGWIEQFEMDVGTYCDDGSMPLTAQLISFRPMILAAAERAERPLDVMDKMRPRMEAAGFINVHQHDYKMPIGTWPKLRIYKDAGRLCKAQAEAGVAGFCLWLLTKYGEPEPWTMEQVMAYVAESKKELNAGYHIYHKARRVWAQKPYIMGPPARPPRPPGIEGADLQ